ncbi:MAG: hypothetical protein ACRD1S_09435 [Vicinamibacterales bacterium]
MTRFVPPRAWPAAALLVCLSAGVLDSQSTSSGTADGQAGIATPSLRTWLGREPEIERYMREAEIARIEAVPIGASRPMRAYFTAGGPVESAAWKTQPPGTHRGHPDNYKAEIAAYELDKLLNLRMVPPSVETRVKGELGALILWLSPTRMWKDVEKEPNPNTEAWNDQVIRMKMFDNLICNRDRNMGNLLVDASWNLYLIDHNRAFITSKDLPVRMSRVCRELWDRIAGLDEPTLKEALGPYLTPKEIRAILQRRDRMARKIDEMKAAHGEQAVIVQ